MVGERCSIHIGFFGGRPERLNLAVVIQVLSFLVRFDQSSPKANMINGLRDEYNILKRSGDVSQYASLYIIFANTFSKTGFDIGRASKESACLI